MAEKKDSAKKAEPAKATTAKKAEPAKATTTAKKAEPAKTTTTAKKTEPAKTATTVKKTEPAKAATTAKKAEPAKTMTTAKKTEPAKTATTAKKVEPAKTATTAKKVEPAKTATTAKKTEPAKTVTTAKKAESAKAATAEKKPSFADRKSSTATSAAATSLMSDNDYSYKKPTNPKNSTATTKTTTAKTSKPTSKKGSSDENKKKKIMIASIASACVFVVLLSVILGVTLSGAKNPVKSIDRYDLSYSTNTVVRYGEQVLGTVNRNKPVKEVQDERSAFDAALFAGHENDRYPTYGSTPRWIVGEGAEQVAARQAMINEASYLCAMGTAGVNGGAAWTSERYNIIDKDGYLWQQPTAGAERIHALVMGKTEYTESNYRRLYKHTASKGLYGGDVSDSEQGIVKEITFSKKDYLTGYGVTGLYAPAGEVIKVEMSEEDMNATGGITIHIGQALFNGQANNIWAGKNTMPRFPIILNTLAINKSTTEYNEKTKTYTGYIGSFVGGPIYVRNESATFNVTISGGVAYSHFILGYTTQEEFEKNRKSSAPYFDLEVWDNGVLHSGPRSYADPFSYDDLYKAAVLWDKVSSVTASGGSKYGIVFIYDPFVAAGAAVAFPGRNSVNCPSGWMSSSLNYEATVTSGSWGNFHEYHHNFQNYGVGDTGEVTNNGLNLVSYSLFTNISSSRQISGFGGAGLSGWNQYTSATWALNQVNNGAIGGTNGLAVYSTLLHNFGQDVYINARGAWGANYLNRYAALTHQDFSYFDSKITNYTGGRLNPAATSYPLFVPVSSVYQTGRTYNYDGQKREITTMQPYVIPYGKDFTVDLRPYKVNSSNQYEHGSVIIGGLNAGTGEGDFTYKIKSVNAKNSNGKFVETSEKGVYTFTPNTKNLLSGKIYVTLEITATDPKSTWANYKIDDVDLILEFKQSHEMNKSVLERTTYQYTADKAYTDAREAFEAGYKGYSSKLDRDHSNPTQNSNTDIWYCTETTLPNFPKANPELDVVKPYTIDEIRGKLYFPEAGRYNIYLRGRRNCAVYYSTDGGKTYKLGTYIADTSTSSGWRTDKYFTLEQKAESWVYFKEVLINEEISARMAGFVGLGIGTWTVPMYTTKEDENGVTHYYNSAGKEVSAEEASNTEPVAPKSISYPTAYRPSYEFQKQFTSDYFYTRSYSYNYTDNVSVPQNEVTLIQSNYAAPPTNWGWGNFPVANLTDGNPNTYIHTNWRVTEAKPLNLTLDLGEVRKLNRISFYCRNNNGQLETPKVFTVEGSLDGNTWFEVAKYDDAPRNGNTVTADFNETKMRYCRLSISSTHQGSYYVVIGQITFIHSTEVLGGTLITPDNSMFSYKGKWYGAQANSSFGHVYVGKKGATVTFEFEGSRIGILSNKAYGGEFEVKVDKKKVSSIDLKKDSSSTYASFISGKLPAPKKGKKHKVTIKCKDLSSIDAIVIYP